jgi:hypothetical protein
MGKKSFLNMGKKSFFKSRVKPFMKSNGMVWAAIAGAAVGIVITRLLGSEKAREVLASVPGNVRDLSHRVLNGTKEAALKMQKAS